MNKNKFLALAMAGAMMTGTLATAVPVFAEDNNTTTVSLTVAPKNTYTMTVPANTTLNSDGTAIQLTNGIKITDGTLEDGKKLTVKASSGNSWKMKADNVSTEIGYTLYSDAGTTEATSWEFTQTEANAEKGTTKNVYAKADATAAASAAAGAYSDVITFTASVEDAAPKYADKLVQASGDTIGDYMDLSDEQATALAIYQMKKLGVPVAVVMSKYDENGYYFCCYVTTDGMVRTSVIGSYSMFSNQNVKLYYVSNASD